MTVIFEQHGGGTAGTTHWLVELLDEPGRVPGLVRFRKTNRMRNLLDQTAQWLPEGRWDTRRWVPSTPPLPKWLIQRIEAHMLQEGINGQAD